MKKILSLLLIVSSIVLLASCTLITSEESDVTTSTDEVTTVQNYHIYTKDPYIDLYVGETKYLQYTLDFELPEGEKLEFSSSDTDVAKVLSTGYVMAKGKGTCNIYISYGDTKLTYYVTCSQDSSLTEPLKTTYYTDEEVDLTGAEIILYNNDHSVSKVIEVTSDMLKEVDTSKAGMKEVKIEYKGETYTFTINVIEREFEAFLIDEIDCPESLMANTTLEMNIIPKDVSALKDALNSTYDYTEFKILVDIESPSGDVDTVYTYYTQDYTEKRKTLTSMNTGKNFEGNVFSRTGENYSISFILDSDPYYKMKYVPTEVGKYTYTVTSYRNDNTLVETKSGEFTVKNGSSSKGIIKVSDNKKTFEFENGDSYLAVGENVAWYTSQERRYGDYELIMGSLASNNCTYIRVWLSGFSFSLFWDDVENYDTKLDEAYELDKIFELGESLGIYIDLTMFHHGMFSAKVNPMWPNNINDWYVDKYGANPYSEKLSSPGEFFTSAYGKKWCKNYLTYIAARYGSYSSLMSYEIFNEVDWVESYTASMGAEWHDEMAKTIKSVDYRGHLVTTSVKGDDFYSDIYQVFSLDSIDYVNVHNYGTYNYLTYMPSKVATAYKKFNKPIIYQEVGYSGNGGKDQYTKDPDNVTLHQELWAGLMSSGATGMNWWWDSWIEPYNCYSYYKAAGKYASLMDLSGDMELAYSSKRVSNSSSSIVALGYLFNDKAYVYLYDKNYCLDDASKSISTTLTLTGFDAGTYKVEHFNTSTGNITSTESITASGGTLKISVSGTNDTALIITK